MANAIKACQSKGISLIDRLFKRDLIRLTYPDKKEIHDEIRRELNSHPATVYAGFDPTSDSLHVGNLAVIMNLLHFLNDGHQVVCVIGDATARIGDPSGHNVDRSPLSNSIVDENSNHIEASLRSIFANFKQYFAPTLKSTTQLNTNPPPLKEPIFVRNSSWYNDVTVIDFMDKVFRHIRVGDLLHKKSIHERLTSGEGMNMSEFSYQIFQAFDWQILRQKYNCKFQVGGADQAGNIYTGHDFLKKFSKHRDSYGLLVPLLVDEAGKKFGKTSHNTVAKSKTLLCLNSNRTSPPEMYRKVIKTPHSFMDKFLKTYTFLELDVIEYLIKNELKEKSGDAKTQNCHKVLARDICLLVHGQQGLDEALSVIKLN